MKPPELISSLRRIRGLTQTQLAEIAGVSLGTIQVAESLKLSQDRKLTQNNALRIYRALHSVLPIPLPNAEAFLEHYGLSPDLAAAPLPPSAQAPRVQSDKAASVSEALKIVSRLFEILDPETVVVKLRSLLPGDEDADTRTLITPPRNSRTIPGATEQEFVTYSQRPKSTPAIKRASKLSR